MHSNDKPITRPDIAVISESNELRRWYWRKDELTDHARSLRLKTTSGKFVILERIAHFLDTGETTYPGDQSKPKQSKFDWNSESLSSSTVVTDSYKNTENVRRFFEQTIGEHFKFNIAFMDWIRSNEGKTLADACLVYQEIRNQEKIPGHRTNIKEHNQFNQYTRDFLDDNPALGLADVRRVWAKKIKLPSDTGRHEYNPADLELP